MKQAVFFLTLSAAAFAQTGVTAPQAGLVLGEDGVVRPLLGMSQSFLWGDPVQAGVVALGCAGTACVWKTDTAMTDGTNTAAAPGGAALISVKQDGTALVYFAAANQFAWFRNGALENLDWDAGGMVLAIRAQGHGAHIAVQRGSSVWVIRENGDVEQALPDGVTTAALLDGRMVYATADAVVLQKGDGSTLSFPVSGAVALRELSPRYVQISTPGGDFVLRLDDGHEEISMLPAAPAEAAQ